MADAGKATWLVEVQNDQADSYSLTGAKNSPLGTVDPGGLLDVTITASNCKKQPELTAVQLLASDNDSGIWYIFTYKDGKAKGKLHDSSDPGWLGILGAVAEAAAEAQYK
jgi:hypothetical protein